MSREPVAVFLLAITLAWTSVDLRRPGVVGAQGGNGAGGGRTDAGLPLEGQPRTGRDLLGLHLGEQLPAGAFASPSAELFVLLATLPDPRASHLDWAYDSHLDGIRRAFERAGFVMDRFDLPWEGAGASTELADQDAGLPGRPGVLLFRQVVDPGAEFRSGVPPTRLWLVYLIGELSTGGIDRDALEAALEERAELLHGDARTGPGTLETLPLVGPVFSGSSLSLRRALEDPSLATTTLVEIVSGSATSPSNARVLDRESTPRIRFRSALHTDGTLLAIFEERVLPSLGLAKDEIAILQESTTEYGQSAAGAQPRDASMRGAADPACETDFLRIPFPMSISSLRRAYFEGGGAAPTEEAMPGRSARSIVGLDLKGRKMPAETVGGLSEMTPPSIDLLLEETTRMLAQHGIRGVLIFATDVRDKLFLGTELRKRLPDLQLFTTESNILYVWSELNRSLRGMIVLSSYPLMLRDTAWRPQASDCKQLIFANEGAEGTFNATLLQLGKETALADYGHPLVQPSGRAAGEVALERPPVWVTVVGAGTMLPLAVFDPGRHLEKPVPAATPAAAATAVPGRGEKSFGAGRAFVAVAGISLFALILLAALSVNWWEQRGECSLSDRLLRTAGEREPGPWHERHARILQISLALHHELYTIFYYASLACLLLPAVLLILLRGSFRLDALILPRVLGPLALGACAVAIFFRARAAIAIVKLHGRGGVQHVLSRPWPSRAERQEWGAEVILRLVVVVLAAVYAIVSVCFCTSLVRLAMDEADPARFELFFHRSIEVDQGVSALVPLAILGAILAAWCQWHLFRIRALATPQLAEVALERESAGPDPSAAISDVRKRLFNVVPGSSATWVLIGIALGSLWTFFQFARSIDDLALDPGGWPSAFDLLLRAGMVGALGATAWATVRLLSVWGAFARELRMQDARFQGLPFADLRTEAGVAPSVSLFPSSPALELVCVAQSRWSRLLELAPAEELVGPEGLEGEDRRALRERCTVEWEFGPRLANSLRALMAKSRHRAAERREDHEAAKGRQEAVLGVVAIELALYREWVLRHMRRLSFFILLSIVLTTLLISSYPFQPQHLIRTISMFVFAAAIGGLIWTIASMNRNPSLSRMSGTNPGTLTWDRSLYVNLGLYVIVPAITLLSSQAPALRKILFQWVEPLAGFLVKS